MRGSANVVLCVQPFPNRLQLVIAHPFFFRASGLPVQRVKRGTSGWEEKIRNLTGRELGERLWSHRKTRRLANRIFKLLLVRVLSNGLWRCFNLIVSQPVKLEMTSERHLTDGWNDPIFLTGQNILNRPLQFSMGILVKLFSEVRRKILHMCETYFTSRKFVLIFCALDSFFLKRKKWTRNFLPFEWLLILALAQMEVFRMFALNGYFIRWKKWGWFSVVIRVLFQLYVPMYVRTIPRIRDNRFQIARGGKSPQSSSRTPFNALLRGVLRTIGWFPFFFLLSFLQDTIKNPVCTLPQKCSSFFGSNAEATKSVQSCIWAAGS